jgi:hypothetical protein
MHVRSCWCSRRHIIHTGHRVSEPSEQIEALRGCSLQCQSTFQKLIYPWVQGVSVKIHITHAIGPSECIFDDPHGVLTYTHEATRRVVMCASITLPIRQKSAFQSPAVACMTAHCCFPAHPLARQHMRCRRQTRMFGRFGLVSCRCRMNGWE